MATDLVIEPFGAALGAVVTGVDLARLSGDTAADVRAVLLDHLVVAFPAQHLDDAGHLAFARSLGEPYVHPMERIAGETTPTVGEISVASDHGLQTDTWHLDVTYSPTPPSFGILRAVDVPAYGGDTMWANLHLAYDRLDNCARERLEALETTNGVPDGLVALKAPKFGAEAASRWRAELTDVRHPVIRTHPETGRKAVFAIGTGNPIAGMDADESHAVLDELTRHSTNLNFTCRWRWSNGDVVVWDERCTAHYAVRDPWPGMRTLRRMLVEGDRPA